MYTVDASVHLSALNPYEPESAASQTLLGLVRRRQIPLFCPTLLPVEVAAAVARTVGDADRAVAIATVLRGLPNQTLVPLDDALADVATHLAATSWSMPPWLSSTAPRSLPSTASNWSDCRSR